MTWSGYLNKLLSNTFGFALPHALSAAPWDANPGYVNLPALAALVIGTLVTVRFGVAVAHRLPSRMLAMGFAVFLVVNGSHLLYLAAR